MGFWDFFKAKEYGLKDSDNFVNIDHKIKNLVGHARIIAVSSYVSMIDAFPILANLKLKEQVNNWDFVMITACAGSAILFSKLTLNERESIIKDIMNELNQLNEYGHKAFIDFYTFVVRNIDQNIDPEIAIGLWVLWNLKGSKPTFEELQPAGPIGKFILNNFAGYFSRI